MTTKHIYHMTGTVLSMTLLMLTAACSSDAADGTGSSATDSPKHCEMHLMLSPHVYSEVTATVTRSLPSGYVAYDALPLKMPLERTSIHGYVTQTNHVDFQGDFIYSLNADGQPEWTSKIPLDEDIYYVYGFMPAAESKKVTVTPRADNSFATGAVMTVSGLSAVTTDDPCVIVGLEANAAQSAQSQPSIEQMSIIPGQFSYRANPDMLHQFVYLLIDHLYAALRFQLDINATYGQLRTVKVTRLSLTPDAGAGASTVASVNLTATLTAGNQTAPLAVDVKDIITGAGTEVVVYDGDEQPLSTTATQDYQVCIAPGTNKRFLLRTQYNVYDRKGNLVRSNQTAENVLTIPDGIASRLEKGHMYTFHLTVNPTYLYMLSEPDLDNPTLTLN